MTGRRFGSGHPKRLSAPDPSSTASSPVPERLIGILADLDLIGFVSDVERLQNLAKVGLDVLRGREDHQEPNDDNGRSGSRKTGPPMSPEALRRPLERPARFLNTL